MNKETLYRNLRLIGTICTIILAIIGALGIEVPDLQDYGLTSSIGALIGIIAPLTSYWFNNNHTIGAKMVQPSIKQINSMVKNEVKDMGRGEENE